MYLYKKELIGFWLANWLASSFRNHCEIGLSPQLGSCLWTI